MLGVPSSTPGTESMKIKVFKDTAISLDGVEKIWVWECPHRGCAYLYRNYGQAIHWENIIRGAFQHVKWHKGFNA